MASYLKDKKSGEVLVQKNIIDRKITGWAGGSENKGKGQRDFSDKVAKFVKDGK